MDTSTSDTLGLRENRDRLLNVFAWRFAVVMTFVALLPFFFATGIQPEGTTYIGTPFNSDDHMVYAAWMKQAQEGRFFFDNRFTTDAQPGLTVHLYFYSLGLLSSLTGIIGATTIPRALFSFLFVLLLGQFVRRTDLPLFTSKLAMVFVCLSGGLGFLVWHNFGRTLAKPLTQPFGVLFGNHLPVDVWQPEVFVFPSMLTNGLFMVSLCLVMAILIAVHDARESWRPVLYGAPAMGVLMNIHSYDVLLLGLVLLGLLAASMRHRMVTGVWVARVLVICAGLIPGAAWFIHVLSQDSVFQSRAATPTFTSAVPTLLGGLAPSIVLVAIALWHNKESGTHPARTAMGWAGLLITLGLVNYTTENSFGFTWLSWSLAFVGALAICVLASRPNLWFNLMLAWCTLGFVAPLMPVMFQRKLAAGLAIPFAFLAALGLAELLKRFERQQRNVVIGVCLVLMGGTSLLWLRREFELIRDNVSTTTVQPALLSRDAMRIVEILDADPSPRKVVVAVPGVPNPGPGIDRYSNPLVPDLNPVLSGLGGAYTYAGHWSETPEYGSRRDRSVRELFAASSDPVGRRAFLEEVGASYVVTINPESYPDSPYADLRDLGTVEFSGNQFLIIRVR